MGRRFSGHFVLDVSAYTYELQLSPKFIGLLENMAISGIVTLLTEQIVQFIL